MTGAERRQREKSWGTRVAEAREALGLSQAALASLCRPALTQQTISKIENNEIVPRFRTMEIVATALGTKVELLFPFEARPTSKAAS